MSDTLKIGKYEFKSRLIVGTGKYATLALMAEALEASGADVVTVAVRRVNLTDGSKESLLDFIDRKRYTLLPDPVETLKATQTLVKEGFTVLTYTSDDPILAKRLEDAGATSVMPAGAPIGSGQGILNRNNILIILETLKVPVIVDAGVGTASDVAVAMELGCEGVLLNTGIAGAQDPVRMARAMKLACEAGRLAYLAGRIPKKLYAKASSPTDGVIAPKRGG